MTFRTSSLAAFAVTLGLFGATGALAWTGPSATPPGANASAPLNTSGTGQVKVGGLQLNTGGAAVGLIVGGSAVVNGASALSSNDKLSVSGGNIEVYNPSSSYNVNAPGMVMGTYSGYGYIQAPSGGSVHIWNSGTADIASFSTGYMSMSGTIDATGPASNWAGIFRPNAGPYGLAVTYNSSGCYSYLAYSSYGVYTNCNVTAPAFYYSSDERLKKNIAAIASSTALQDVLALQPVTYEWKKPASGAGTQLGFIAQQVEKVVPELVTTDASTTMKAVDYAKITPLLVGAAQAQQARIDAQDATISAQQKQIDALVAEVKALRAEK